MATALEAYPRVQVVVESVGRGLYSCWRRHMADSDPALLPPPVLRSPGPPQSPLLCICCTRIKDSAVPRGPSVTMDGPMVFCSRGEGLDSPFSCLPLPPATCNLEAQGLDFYYQVLFWLTGSVISEYERLRYWMRRPPNPRSEAAAVVNVRLESPRTEWESSMWSSPVWLRAEGSFYQEAVTVLWLVVSYWWKKRRGDGVVPGSG